MSPDKIKKTNRGYWETHPEQRDKLKAHLERLKETATCWDDVVLATKEFKETVSTLRHFCKKYKIKFPNLQHGGKRYTAETRIGGVF